MQTVPTSFNPFALLIDPKAIFDRIERSERLECLQRRVCRPLDKPLLPTEPGADDTDAESSASLADADQPDDSAAA